MCHKDNPKDRIVVKSITIDPTKSKEILSEVQTLSSCKSPQIIKLKNCFLEEKRIKLVLEFMDCGSLGRIIYFF
jgi:serine/threonine protein kinase